MTPKKKKVLIQTDAAVAKTGFGRTAKALLKYLYNTGKYEVSQYALGCNWHHASTHRTPWSTYGCMPDSQEIQERINKDPSYARAVGYGIYYSDRVMEKVKPDVIIAAQDIWGIDYLIDKSWFKLTTPVIWTTLDSLPILPAAVQKASKIDNYWIWSDFATKALHELGHKHVRTMHGPVECDSFYKLPDRERKDLRIRFKQHIPEDAFVVGFVFRNQLRKSVPNLLEGYAKFKKHSQCKESRLLFHTSFSEGWNILKLAKEYGVEEKEIVTTYVCKTCKQYEVKAFYGENLNCPFCGDKKSCNTSNTAGGVTEKQLNEVYNLMDVYCHPFTSGGQEIPIQEAKLTELITLVTSYSCGEDLCVPEAQSLPLDWTEYREHGTEFRKASTNVNSISKQLKKVYNMKLSKRQDMGKKAREWTLEHYSINRIGAEIEKFIDEAPFTECTFDMKAPEKDPLAQVPDLREDGEWLKWIYHNILKMSHVDETDDGYKYWMEEFKKGATRAKIEKYFRQVAAKENAEEKREGFDIEALVSKDDQGKRIVYIMPGSIGDVFLSTALFKSIKELYPDYNLYVATAKPNQEILDANPYVYKTIDYSSEMDNALLVEGHHDHNGCFEIAFQPYATTQRMLTYLHNGKDKIAYEDLCYED